MSIPDKPRYGWYNDKLTGNQLPHIIRSNGRVLNSYGKRGTMETKPDLEKRAYELMEGGLN